jgi:hypothetical protein
MASLRACVGVRAECVLVLLQPSQGHSACYRIHAASVPLSARILRRVRRRLLSILSAVKEKSEVRNQPTFAQNRFYLCCDTTTKSTEPSKKTDRQDLCLHIAPRTELTEPGCHTAGFRMNLSDGLRPGRAACCTPTDLTKSLSSSSRSGPSMSSTRETRSSIWASLRLYSDR